jgi:hypothetical protein
MSYGVALRNGVPFTLGTIAALCVNATGSAWSPLALWPDGIATPGMWISPRTLTSEWQDYLGTTPVATPGTVADSSNPVGLALDIRAGATVLTDPGNHMLQSTSAARPLASARVNLLQYTEDFTNAAWLNVGTTVTPNYGTAPDGTQTSTRLVFGGLGNYVFSPNILAPISASASCYVKGTAGETLYFENNLATTNQVTLTGSWQLAIKASADGTSFVVGTIVGSTARDVEVWHPQFQLGLTATDYQSVPGDGSTYATGFPIAQKYDGVDDGMATAAFAAGTLISGMDCMIVVRRDGNSQQALGGLYQLDQTKYFGVIGTDSGSAAGTHNGCGTPTIFVDGVEVANTRGALYDAIGLGEFHILEYRGLDLSAWVDAGFGYYASGYQLIGPRGDIMLYPSTTPTADKDAARQWLADYYGVTLP